MDDDIIYSAPPSKSDEELEKGFVTAIIDQPKLLDELAKQLVTVNLAIPGVLCNGAEVYWRKMMLWRNLLA
jgi:hypothetical protein